MSKKTATARPRPDLRRRVLPEFSDRQPVRRTKFGDLFKADCLDPLSKLDAGTVGFRMCRGSVRADFQPTTGFLLGVVGGLFSEDQVALASPLWPNSMRKDFGFEPAGTEADWREQCC